MGASNRKEAFFLFYNPSVSSADSSLYTREPNGRDDLGEKPLPPCLPHKSAGSERLPPEGPIPVPKGSLLRELAPAGRLKESGEKGKKQEKRQGDETPSVAASRATSLGEGG